MDSDGEIGVYLDSGGVTRVRSLVSSHGGTEITETHGDGRAERTSVAGRLADRRPFGPIAATRVVLANGRWISRVCPFACTTRVAQAYARPPHAARVSNIDLLPPCVSVNSVNSV